MEVTETRQVPVKYCDSCKAESKHLEKCAACKKEMCMAAGGGARFAYSIELYRYSDGQRMISHVCKVCANTKTDLTVHQLLDGMMEETAILPRG